MNETTGDRPHDRESGAAVPLTGAQPPVGVTTPPETGPWVPSLLVAGLGLLISFDMLLRTLALMGDHVPGGIDVCTTIFRASCDETLQNSQSWRFGIPAAGWGLAYFATLAWLIFLARALGGWFARRAAAAAVLLCVPGVVVSLVLAAAILLGRAPMCPLCLIVHVTNLVLAILVWRAGRFHRASLPRVLGNGLQWAVGPPGADPPEARWTVFGIANAAMVGLLALQWTSVEIERRGGAGAVFDPKKVFRAYDASKLAEIPTSAEDARLGPPQAPAQLVVFSDFECPGCIELATELDGLVTRHGDKLSVVFKHYPLSTTCNPSMRDDMHPGACTIAAAAEAARLQGRFWAFHDLAFENLEASEDSVLRRIAGEAGLDVDRFERDRRDSTSMARVRGDVALGDRLGVQGTPTVFLNRRMVPDLGRRTLAVLVDRAIRKAEIP